MIEINLLPEKMRSEKKTRQLNLPALPIIPIIIGIIGLIIVIQVILTVSIQVRKAVYSSLSKKLASIEAPSQQVIGLDNKLKELAFKVDTADRLSGERFRLAKKLNDLSDSLVSGVWLRSVEVEKGESLSEPGVLRQVLIIQGSSIVSEANSEGFTGNFVNSLKSNKSFYEDFDDIELSKEERRKIRNTEIMDFVVICHFKKGRGL